VRHRNHGASDARNLLWSVTVRRAGRQCRRIASESEQTLRGIPLDARASLGAIYDPAKPPPAVQGRALKKIESRNDHRGIWADSAWSGRQIADDRTFFSRRAHSLLLLRAP